MQKKQRNMIPVLVAGALICAQNMSLETHRYDFQPEGANLEPGFIEVTPDSLYNATRGLGFIRAPQEARSAQGYIWQVFSKTWDVDLAIADVHCCERWT